MNRRTLDIPLVKMENKALGKMNVEKMESLERRPLENVRI